jgi:hypothetical protein
VDSRYAGVCIALQSLIIHCSEPSLDDLSLAEVPLPLEERFDLFKDLALVFIEFARVRRDFWHPTQVNCLSCTLDRIGTLASWSTLNDRSLRVIEGMRV